MFNKEPTVIFNGLAQLVSLIIPVLILFDFIEWSDTQIAGFMALVTFSAGFLATLLTRSKTVPTQVADKQIEVALSKPADTPPKVVQEIAKDQVNQGR